jgi:hypothetical protein
MVPFLMVLNPGKSEKTARETDAFSYPGICLKGRHKKTGFTLALCHGLSGPDWVFFGNPAIPTSRDP